jgi:hypothetical protein
VAGESSTLEGADWPERDDLLAGAATFQWWLWKKAGAKEQLGDWQSRPDVQVVVE